MPLKRARKSPLSLAAYDQPFGRVVLQHVFLITPPRGSLDQNALKTVPGEVRNLRQLRVKKKKVK